MLTGENGMNLHDVLITPGARRSFRQELSPERLDHPSVLSFLSLPVGEGEIENTAGVLTLHGSIRSLLRCRCDRCAGEFDRPVDIPLEVTLASELEDEESPDFYLLEGDELDLEDLLETSFILETDTRFLCREDCKGLCPRCGADLNLGPCGCKKEKDPRLAVLEQLLDDKD